jgi:proteasome lid subunit RPN8/RPN11
VRISGDQLETILEHARAEQPNECCGVVVTRGGEAASVHRLENLAASPFRFEVDGLSLHRLLSDAEDGGADLGAIYHSHTRSEAWPSQTDVNFAAHWPGVEWLIVGLAGEGDPVVRSFLIEGGEVREVAVERTDG